MFALILNSQEFAARVGIVTGRWMSALRRFVHRGPVAGWDLAVVKFRARVIGLVRERWISLTFWTLVGHLSLYAVLVVTLRQVGVSDDEVGWAEILAVFAFARLLTAIPLTPGGLGIVELALISGLTAAGGDHAQVVASVLVYRVLTYVIPIPFGLVTYVYWRRNKSWLDSAPPLDPRFTAESVEEYVPGSAAATSARRQDPRHAGCGAAHGTVDTRTTPGLRPHRAGGPRRVRTGLPAAARSARPSDACSAGSTTGRSGSTARCGCSSRPATSSVAFVVVLLAAIVLRRPKLAIAAVALVGLKLVLERVVKQVVERQRPGTSIGDVVLRGSRVDAFGLSFVSGHAVLGAAVATVLMPRAPGPLATAPLGLRPPERRRPDLCGRAQPARCGRWDRARHVHWRAAQRRASRRTAANCRHPKGHRRPAKRGSRWHPGPDVFCTRPKG